MEEKCRAWRFVGFGISQLGDLEIIWFCYMNVQVMMIEVSSDKDGEVRKRYPKMMWQGGA